MEPQTSTFQSLAKDLSLELVKTQIFAPSKPSFITLEWLLALPPRATLSRMEGLFLHIPPVLYLVRCIIQNIQAFQWLPHPVVGLLPVPRKALRFMLNKNHPAQILILILIQTPPIGDWFWESQSLEQSSLSYWSAAVADKKKPQKNKNF